MRAAAIMACAIGAIGCVRSPEMRAEGWWSARTAHIALQTDGGEEGAHRDAPASAVAVGAHSVRLSTAAFMASKGTVSGLPAGRAA